MWSKNTYSATKSEDFSPTRSNWKFSKGQGIVRRDFTLKQFLSIKFHHWLTQQFSFIKYKQNPPPPPIAPQGMDQKGGKWYRSRNYSITSSKVFERDSSKTLISTVWNFFRQDLRDAQGAGEWSSAYIW